jgi:hypothetical protein
MQSSGRLASVRAATTLVLAHLTGAAGGDEPIAAEWTVSDGEPGARFAAAVARAGDCDGDGTDDLVVGAHRSGGGAGAVHLVSGRDGALLWTATGAPNAWLGFAVSGAGDLDGDAVVDVLAGAPFEGAGRGAAHALSGRDGALLWSRRGSAPGERLGESVAGLGDLDGDRVGDVAVGIPHHGGAGWRAGRVELLSGLDGAPRAALSGTAFDRLGHAVVGVGDLDGDGAGDCAIGVPGDDRGGRDAGALVVVSGAGGRVHFEVQGDAPGDRLGQGVAAAGDVDGDGVADVLVAAPGCDLAGPAAGRAEVRSGVHGGLLLRVFGERPGAALAAVAGAGDADGDGAADLLVGSARAGGAERGTARLIGGRTGLVLWTGEGLAPASGYGAALAAGDLDGDGRTELAVAAPGGEERADLAGALALVRCGPGDARWSIAARAAADLAPLPARRPTPRPTRPARAAGARPRRPPSTPPSGAPRAPSPPARGRSGSIRRSRRTSARSSRAAAPPPPAGTRGRGAPPAGHRAAA